MPRTELPVVICLILLCASTAVADEAPELKSGAQIRVEVVGGPESSETKHFSGTVLALDDELITLRTVRKRPPMELALRDLRSLKVMTGGVGRGDGAGTGAAIGLGMAVVIGLASGSDNSNEMLSFTAGEKAMLLSIAFVPLGAVVGALSAPGLEWESVPLDSVRLGVGCGPEQECGASMVFSF